MENSPFARLPAELRTAIYEYTFIETEDVFLFCKVCCSGPRTSHNHPLELVQRLALSQTCAQIRREGWPIFFSANIFLCQSYWTCDLDGEFKGTFDGLPLNFLQAIRNVRLQLVDPLCFCSDRRECPGREGRHGDESHVPWKLMKLLQSMRLRGEEVPDCRIVFESRLCYDLDTKIEIVMVEFHETWASTLNHASDERHWKGIVDAEKQASRRRLQECARTTLLRTLTRAMRAP